MNMKSAFRKSPVRKGMQAQRGAAMVIALVMLLVLTLLATASARMTLLEERMTEDNQRLRDANNTLKVSNCCRPPLPVDPHSLFAYILVSAASIAPIRPGSQSC